jgi:hypothetical protein
MLRIMGGVGNRPALQAQVRPVPWFWVSRRAGNVKQSLIIFEDFRAMFPA